MKNVLGMLKGESKYETLENYSIVVIFLGAVILAAGIGLNVITTVGFPTIMAMLGAFISFVGTIALIFVWLFKEMSE